MRIAKQDLTKRELKQIQIKANKKRVRLLPYQKEQIIRLRFDPNDRTRILNSYTKIARILGLKRRTVHSTVF